MVETIMSSHRIGLLLITTVLVNYRLVAIATDGIILLKLNDEL